MAKCPFYISVKASIVDSVRIGRGKKNEIIHDSIRGDSETMPQLFNWDFCHISPTKSDSRLFFFLFIQAYEIMSQLICLNGQRRILEKDKNVAPGKNQAF